MVDIVTRLGKGSPLTNAEVDANFTNLAEVSGVTGEPMGHEDRTTSTISFNASTRTFTIAPTASSFTVWCKGKKVVVSSAQTVVIPNTTGMYSIYFDSTGALAAKAGYFTFAEEAPTAYVYWNATTGTAPYFGDERHGVVLDWQTHEYLHRTRGAALASGFSASGYVLGGNGSSNSHAQLTIEGGTFFDEDMKIIVTATNTPTAGTWEQDLTSPARIPVLYLSGTAWVIDAPTDYPLKQGTARPQYNAYSGGVWSTADVANNKYSTTWILATNNLTYPVIAIIGQAESDLQSAAEAVDFTELQLPGFPSVEFRPLYKLIFQCADSCTNAVHASLVSITDIRSIAAAGTAASIVTDHGNLSGLSDDDHPQYIHVDTLRTVSAAVKASFLPSQTSNAGKFLQTDGTATSWQALTSGNVTTALGFTPYNATNPSGYISGITSGMVTTALGFTPYNATNPSGYVNAAGARGAISVTGAGSYDSATGVINIVGGVTSFNTRTGAITLSSSDVTTALGFTPYNSTNPNGYLTGITSTQVTTALGYTPYNSSNPSGYITGITSGMVTTALGFTPYNNSNPSGYITSAALSPYLTTASAASTYLPLAGGTLTGRTSVAFSGMASPSNTAILATSLFNWTGGGGDYLSLGQYANSNFWIQAAYQNPSLAYYAIALNPLGGNVTMNGNTVLNTGNFNSYAPAISYSRFTGDINTLGVSNATSGIYNIGAGYTNGPGSTTLYGTLQAYWNGDIAVQFWHSYNGDSYWRKSIGSTFSGAAWRTNLDSSNYNSYAPTLTGTGASGTWGISISGNSATTSQRAFSGDISTTGQGRFTGWHAGGAATGVAVEVGVSSSEGYILTYNRNTSSYVILNIAASGANMQFNGSTINVTSGSLQQGGNQVLHAGNINSYIPSWSTGVNASHIVQRDTNGYIYANHINFNTSESENATVNSFITSNGDGWSRKASLAHVKNSIRGVADGTWGIDISGTAANTDAIDGVGFRNTGSNSGTNADTIESNGITYYTAGVPNFTGNSTDGALYSQAYSSSWQHQIAGDYRSGQIALRGKNAGTWQSWRTVLDSSNYSSYALPLSGGTLTGALVINSNNGVSAIYDGTDGQTWLRGWGIESNRANAYFRPMTNNSATLRIGYSEGANNWSTVQVDAASFTKNGNTVLHGANYNSYAPTLTGGGASGTWGINITGSANSASTAAKSSSTTVPASTAFARWLFATNSTSGTQDWNHVSNTRPGVGEVLLLGNHANGPGGSNYYHPLNFEYSSIEGSGNVTQLAIAYGSPGNELYMRGSYGGSWNGWNRFLNSSNYSSYALPLSGGSLTGALSAVSGLRSYYSDHIAGDGYGIRFWESNSYKISMGVSSSYQYGTVTDYSIKMQMDVGSPNRGFTWGRDGVTPIASLNSTSGNFQTSGQMYVQGAQIASGALTVRAGGAGGVGWGTGLNIGDSSNYTGFIQDAGTSRWRNFGTGGYDWYNSGGSTVMALSNGGALTVVGNAVLTAGNFSSYSHSIATSDSRYSRKDTTSQWIKPYYEYGNYLTSESPATLKDQMGGGGLRVDFMNPSYTGSGGWNHVITWSGYNMYNMYQLGGHYDGGTGTDLWVRSEANHGGTSWTAWRKLLNSSNYNSYSPTLTGGSASGTWGINVTGNAGGTAARATRANGNFYIDDNHGNGVVGVYSSYRYQTVYAMGDSYKMSADGTSLSNMYGIAWSHPNAGGAAGNLTDHGLLIINAGAFKCAISNSIVASANITAYSDERLKTNWRDMPENYVARLAQVKVGIYDRTDQEDVTQVGVSAQSFQKLLPQAIMTAKDEMQTLSVSYGNAALASAVELAKDNVELRARIERLESLINKLIGD